MSDRRPGAFLDRDGTIIVDVDHVRRAEDVSLIPGAAEAIAALNGAGIPVIVVTNQSGIARGLFTEKEYEEVTSRMDALLSDEGAHIDASYYCPHHPEFGGLCACRKPGTLLYEQAVTDLGLDPAASAYFGDRWRDVAAATTLGGRGYLIPSPATTAEDRFKVGGAIRVASSLAHAISDAFGLTTDKLSR